MMVQACKRLLWPFLIALLGSYAGLHGMAAWLDLPATGEPENADVIVILAGDMEGRIDLGAALFHTGAAPAVWITGDAFTADRVTLGETMRHRAFLAGVPYRVQTLLASTSTLEDAQAIAAMVRERKVRRLILVTSWYHGRRAVCTIGNSLAGSDVAIVYQPAMSAHAPQVSWWYRPAGIRTLIRETLATAYYSLRYGLTPESCTPFTALE